MGQNVLNQVYHSKFKSYGRPEKRMLDKTKL